MGLAVKMPLDHEALATLQITLQPYFLMVAKRKGQDIQFVIYLRRDLYRVSLLKTISISRLLSRTRDGCLDSNLAHLSIHLLILDNSVVLGPDFKNSKR